MRTSRQKTARILILAALVALSALVVGLACGGRGGAPRPIPRALLDGLVREPEFLVRTKQPNLAGAVAYAPIPQHPFMAAGSSSNMHNDAYMSDTYEASGPLGLDAEVRSRTQGFGGYGTVAFDSHGRLVGVYSNARAFQLELMDPDTLEELASYDLPPRPLDFVLEGVMPWEYIGAGMYFYLDQNDRAVVPTTANTVEVVQVPGLSETEFTRVREYDLAGHVVPRRWPGRDSVAWVLPDWSGQVYWYATTAGMVGLIDRESGTVTRWQLKGEPIENSFAVGEDGTFIISDRAMYRFSRETDGRIAMDWRTEYDRGPRRKPGVITRGSGSSVTLMGDASGFVAITDNAAPRVNALFIRRSDGEVVCRVPVFEVGRSATDITLIGFEHADARGQPHGVYSVVVENNWGRNTFPRARPAAGVARVDLIRAADGSYTCKPVWSNSERNIGVFKLSLGNGLLYLYFRDGAPVPTRWYFTAVDFATGETVYRQLAGTGLRYNNWAGAMFIHPESGALYSTTIFGLVMMRDGSRPIPSSKDTTHQHGCCQAPVLGAAFEQGTHARR
jgi:hypothetical protein